MSRKSGVEKLIGRNMRIETITFFFNEEFLIPFYLNHYVWVDRINAIYDEDSTDNTLDLLNQNSKVNIIRFRFPDMMDDIIKVEKINLVYKNLNTDLVINVDADEFIFLSRQTAEELDRDKVYYVQLFNVYRHRTENDLNPQLSIKSQRRYGCSSSEYKKPIVVPGRRKLEWTVGNHELKENNFQRSEQVLKGAHWKMADRSFAIKRRLKDRKERQSKTNLEKGLTKQNHYIKIEDLEKEFVEHENDPQLW